MNRLITGAQGATGGRGPTVGHIATTTHLTRLDAALPFLLAAALVLVGALVAMIVTLRVEALFHQWARDANEDENDLPYTFRPESIAQMSQWIVDAAQVFTSLLAPLIGLTLLLKHGASDNLILLYVAALLIALAALVFFLRRDASFYGTRSPPVLTPIVTLALTFNVIGAGLAYLIGP
jgi:hypothetical protein